MTFSLQMRPLGCNMSTTVGLSALHNPDVTFWCKINQCKAISVYPESANPRELQETFPNFLIFPSAVGGAALKGESSSIFFCTDKIFFLASAPTGDTCGVLLTAQSLRIPSWQELLKHSSSDLWILTISSHQCPAGKGMAAARSFSSGKLPGILLCFSLTL